MVRELGCHGADGADCDTAALQAGFHSAWQYTAISILYELYLAPMGTILVVPVVLLACDWVSQLEDTALRWCLGSCLAACIMYLSDVHIYLERGMLMAATLKNSLIWLTGFMCSVTLDLWLLWFLFFRKRHQKDPRLLVCG